MSATDTFAVRFQAASDQYGAALRECQTGLNRAWRALHDDLVRATAEALQRLDRMVAELDAEIARGGQKS